MEYTIKDISLIIGKSPQTIYKQIRKDKELKQIVEDPANKRTDRLTNTIYYSENVLDYLCALYEIKKTIEKSVPPQSEEQKPAEHPKETAPTVEDTDITYYTDKIKSLKKKLKHQKEENKRLIAENERLLTLLEQGQKHLEGIIVGFMAEKKEKTLLLEDPARKKHWWSRK